LSLSLLIRSLQLSLPLPFFFPCGLSYRGLLGSYLWMDLDTQMIFLFYFILLFGLFVPGFWCNWWTVVWEQLRKLEISSLFFLFLFLFFFVSFWNQRTFHGVGCVVITVQLFLKMFLKLFFILKIIKLIFF